MVRKRIAVSMVNEIRSVEVVVENMEEKLRERNAEGGGG